MAETVGILDAGQVDSLTKRINHAEAQMPGDSGGGVYANAKLLGDSGGGEYPEITTLRDIYPGEEILMHYGNHFWRKDGDDGGDNRDEATAMDATDADDEDDAMEEPSPPLGS